jgi:hypothetical protein
MDVIRAAWAQAGQAFSARHPRVAAMLEGAEPARTQKDVLTLSLPAQRVFLQKSLEAAAQREVVESVLAEVLGARPRVRFEFGQKAPEAQGPKKKDVHADPAVRKVVEALGGGVIHVEQGRG